MVEITLPIMLQIVQTVSISLGIIYHLFNMRNAQKTRELTLKAQEQALETRQAQLYMSLLNRWNTKEFSKMRYDTYRMEWTDMDDFRERYSLEKTPEIFASYNTFGRSILSLAELKRKGLIEYDFLDGMMLADILNWWVHFGALEKERWERGNPAWYNHFPFILEVIEYDRRNRPAGYDRDGKYRFTRERIWVQPEEIMKLKEKFIEKMQNK